MARPAAKELTQRELEVMQVFWKHGAITSQQARDELAAAGVDRAYTTVATLIRILTDKGFLKQTTSSRPFGYRAVRSHQEVSRLLLSDLVDRVFHGSREQLILRLMEHKKLSAKERARLEQILRENRT